MMVFLVVAVFSSGLYASGYYRLLVGRITCIGSDKQEFWPLETTHFLIACDERTTIAGWCADGQEVESFLLANTGNSKVISVEAERQEGEAPLSMSQGWRVRFFVEQGRMPLMETFESRYSVVNSASISRITIPIGLYWEQMGIERMAVERAWSGQSIVEDSGLGLIEIDADDGIRSIRLSKMEDDFYSAKGKALKDFKISFFPEGLKSISESYVFSPARVVDKFAPFACGMQVKFVDANGRRFGAQYQIDVTRHEDERSARRFIDNFLSRLPTTIAIISNSNLTTVLEDGEQKKAIDLDVQDFEDLEFEEGNGLSHYLVLLGGITIICSIAIYLRYSR